MDHHPDAVPASVTLRDLPDCSVLECEQCEQWVRRPLGIVFEFFSDARNLERITPPFLRFHVLGTSTPGLELGTEIRYRLRLHGIPVPWTSRIEAWDPPHRFVDVQVRGPFRLWHHQHQFAAERDGTRIRDVVEFRVPLRGLRRTPLVGWVERDVRAIFLYRQKVLPERLAATPDR